MEGEIVEDGPIRKFAVKYELGHEYQEEWLLSNFFCPSCGKKTLWIDQGIADYEAGASHLCESCGAKFCTHVIGARSDNWQDQQRIAHLRGEPPPLKTPRLKP